MRRPNDGICQSPKKKATYKNRKWPYRVEAAGIEPASRDVSEQTSTCVFGQLKSYEDTPGRQGVALTSPEQIWSCPY